MIRLISEPNEPEETRSRIPSGEAASGSDGLFEAVVGHHEACPSGLPGERDNEKHVVAIDESPKVIAKLRRR